MAGFSRPIPAEIHVLKGTRSQVGEDYHKKDRSEKNGEIPKVTPKLPAAPRHLSPIARAEWKRLGRELLEVGLVSEVDRSAFAVYCQEYARWVEVEQKIAERGYDGIISFGLRGEQLTALVKLSNQCIKNMTVMMREFGLTPSARMTVRIAPKHGSSKDKTGPSRFFAD
jgi:P27 family predicted phage terminase small subunit